MDYIIFGAGKDAGLAIRSVERKGGKVKYLVDNFHYNFQYEVGEKTYSVFYPTKLFEEKKGSIKIVISSVERHTEIVPQLDEMGFMLGRDYVGWPGYVQGKWEETGIFHPEYELRVHFMSQLISPDSESVLDLGCGKMFLKKYLKDTIKYIPCDYVKHDEDTVQCDLNNAFPDVYPDTIFMSGIFEYMVDYAKFTKHVCAHAKKEVVFSYNTLDYRPNLVERRRLGLLNHLSLEEIMALFEAEGMELTFAKETVKPKQCILRFSKKA